MLIPKTVWFTSLSCSILKTPKVFLLVNEGSSATNSLNHHREGGSEVREECIKFIAGLPEDELRIWNWA